MFPPAIDVISTSLAVAYSDRKYTNKKMKRHNVTYSPIDRIPKLTHVGGGGERGEAGHISSGGPYVQLPQEDPVYWYQLPYPSDSAGQTRWKISSL